MVKGPTSTKGKIAAPAAATTAALSAAGNAPTLALDASDSIGPRCDTANPAPRRRTPARDATMRKRRPPLIVPGGSRGALLHRLHDAGAAIRAYGESKVRSSVCFAPTP